MGTSKLFLIIFVLLIVPTSIIGHGNILYSVDLDFDPEMKEGVTKAAQEYLGITEEPIEFDYDFELIIVKFDRKLELSVLVHPITFEIHGFRDDSRVVRDGKENYDSDERYEIAVKKFNELPQKYKNELKFGEGEQLYVGTYQYRWYRYVDGIYVSNEHLSVEVDADSGEIVSWRLSSFFYSASKMDITPAISHFVSEQIALIQFKAEKVEFDPILLIEKDYPIWVVKVKGLFPFFVAVRADNGEIIYSGSLKTDLPENYDYGREVPIVESSLISEIYG